MLVVTELFFNIDVNEKRSGFFSEKTKMLVVAG